MAHTRKRKIKKYVIIGKRWFDKVNGNTYHSVRVIDVDTNKVIAQEDFVYGYGDQYRHTAFDLLKKKGLVKESTRFNHALNRERFIFSVADVPRKKDLLYWG